jgi:hypothetical protein
MIGKEKGVTATTLQPLDSYGWPGQNWTVDTRIFSYLRHDKATLVITSFCVLLCGHSACSISFDVLLNRLMFSYVLHIQFTVNGCIRSWLAMALSSLLSIQNFPIRPLFHSFGRFLSS